MSAKKKTVITAQDILAKFMEYVLDKGRWPVSVYQFCKEVQCWCRLASDTVIPSVWCRVSSFIRRRKIKPGKIKRRVVFCSYGSLHHLHPRAAVVSQRRADCQTGHVDAAIASLDEGLATTSHLDDARRCISRH